jgi:hypothetical protein
VTNPVSRLLQRHALHQAVSAALSSGVGLYRMSWPTGTTREADLAEAVIGWCRRALSAMHRPYGVDSVSLALVAHDGAQRPYASAQFSVLHPMDFYAMGEAETQARRALESWHEAGFLSDPGARLSAVLFSWGDLTQQLVLAE